MKPGTHILESLDPARPISPQISRGLRDAIIRNRLTPGNRISESEIARGCNVSRQPVREAFIKLAAQGLLLILPQRGTIVSRIAYSAVLDARFLREAIEADIVKILAQRADPTLVADLCAQVEKQKAVAGNAPHDFIQLDETFHRTLAEAAGKATAWRQVEGLKAQMDRVRFLSLGQFPVTKLIAQHGAIVDAIAKGDVPSAERAVRLHLREILRDLPTVVAAHPDFFELPDGALPEPVNVPIQGGDL